MAFEIGNVYIGDSRLTEYPKMFVVLSYSTDRQTVYTLIISSELNEYQQRNEEIRAQKMPLSMAGRPYLLCDSFLNCEPPPFQESKAHLFTLQKRFRLLGRMSESDLLAAKKILKANSSEFDWPEYGIDEDFDDIVMAAE